MKNNNSNFPTMWIISIIGILLLAVGYFVPKSVFDMGSSKKDFANFKERRQNTGNTAMPSELKWKKSFAFDKKKQKQQGSYIQYLFKKNKKQ